MTKEEKSLVIDAISDISVKAIDMECPKKYTNWLAKKIKALFSELGFEREWDNAIAKKGANYLRKVVETDADDPISKAIGTLLVEILAGFADDEEEDEE